MITIKDFTIQINEKDTFGVWISITKEIQEKYEEKFGIKDNGMNALWAEYHSDDNSYSYCFLPSNASETFDVTEDFSYLNNLMHQYYMEKVKQDAIDLTPISNDLAQKG